MSEPIKLKSCPFCGVMPKQLNGEYVFKVNHKPECFFVGCLSYFDKSDIPDWNRRPVEDALVEALKPFAAFADRLFDGRRGIPAEGPWHGLDSGCSTEANITIEMFKAAQQALADLEK